MLYFVVGVVVSAAAAAFGDDDDADADFYVATVSILFYLECLTCGAFGNETVILAENDENFEIWQRMVTTKGSLEGVCDDIFKIWK